MGIWRRIYPHTIVKKPKCREMAEPTLKSSFQDTQFSDFGERWELRACL